MFNYFRIFLGLLLLMQWTIDGSESQCQNNESGGPFCLDETAVGLCVNINGKWETFIIENCTETTGSNCDEISSSCLNNDDSEVGFQCGSAGVFPDPYNCSIYHFCVMVNNGFQEFRMECPANTAFSAATGLCSVTTSNAVCTEPQFICNTVGQQAAWPNNDNIFYICKATVSDSGIRIIYPSLYRCGPTEIFTGTSCVGAGGPDDITTTTQPNVTEQFECQRPGLFPNLADCTTYFSCNANLQQTLLPCPANTHFSTQSMSCVRGSC